MHESMYNKASQLQVRGLQLALNTFFFLGEKHV